MMEGFEKTKSREEALEDGRHLYCISSKQAALLKDWLLPYIRKCAATQVLLKTRVPFANAANAEKLNTNHDASPHDGRLRKSKS